MGIFNKVKSRLDNLRIVDKKKYEKGLSKTRSDLSAKLSNLASKHSKVNDEYFEDLEELLISSDIGVNTVIKFVEKLKSRANKEKLTDPNLLKEVIVDELFIIYVDNQIITNKINYAADGPTIILVIGVNGVGKTTTIAKLANMFKNDKRKTMVIAADTFRAGAKEQLESWALSVGVDFFEGSSKDPAGVVYDGVKKAKDEDYDVVLVDTAGRLQNKNNLMNELSKINKTINKHIENAPHETMLVLDATTGQNGISQAKSFKEIANVSSITLTKLDGTAKGGIVLAIKDEVGIPVKYIGLGEGIDDLKPFDIEAYIYGLFKED